MWNCTIVNFFQGKAIKSIQIYVRNSSKQIGTKIFMRKPHFIVKNTSNKTKKKKKIIEKRKNRRHTNPFCRINHKLASRFHKAPRCNINSTLTEDILEKDMEICAKRVEFHVIPGVTRNNIHMDLVRLISSIAVTKDGELKGAFI